MRQHGQTTLPLQCEHVSCCCLQQICVCVLRVLCPDQALTSSASGTLSTLLHTPARCWAEPCSVCGSWSPGLPAPALLLSAWPSNPGLDLLLPAIVLWLHTLGARAFFQVSPARLALSVKPEDPVM